jgi:hypothetical protein
MIVQSLAMTREKSLDFQLAHGVDYAMVEMRLACGLKGWGVGVCRCIDKGDRSSRELIQIAGMAAWLYQMRRLNTQSAPLTMGSLRSNLPDGLSPRWIRALDTGLRSSPMCTGYAPRACDYPQGNISTSIACLEKLQPIASHAPGMGRCLAQRH